MTDEQPPAAPTPDPTPETTPEVEVEPTPGPTAAVEDPPDQDGAAAAGTPPAPKPSVVDSPSYRATVASASPAFGAETIEEFGRPMRRFTVAVSAEVMALAWANREDAPQGAAVVVEREIGARGLHGRLWEVPFEDTLSCAVVLRPQLSVEEAGATWLVGALAALGGAEAVSGRSLATLWPDSVIESGTDALVGVVKSEIQLGPGKVKAAVSSVRLDMSALGIPHECRDELLEAVMTAFDEVSQMLEDGPAALATAYQERCAVIGKRVKLRLLPKGETRGLARSIDNSGRLELASTTGMVERIAVDQLRDLTVV